MQTRLAEMAIRLQRMAEAQAHFKEALQLGITDQFLLGAYADFLLQQKRPAEVLKLLADWERSDILLLRLALAGRALNDPRAAGWAAQLRDRFAAAAQRGDRLARAGGRALRARRRGQAGQGAGSGLAQLHRAEGGARRRNPDAFGPGGQTSPRPRSRRWTGCAPAATKTRRWRPGRQLAAQGSQAMTRWLAISLALLLHAAAAWAHKPSDSYLTLRGCRRQRRHRRALGHRPARPRLRAGARPRRQRRADLGRGAPAQRRHHPLCDEPFGAVRRASKACPWELPRPADAGQAQRRHLRRAGARGDVATACAATSRPLFACCSTWTLRTAAWCSGSHRAAWPRRPWCSAPIRPSRRWRCRHPSAWQTLRQYVVEGVWHIWIGFDHILFLLSLAAARRCWCARKRLGTGAQPAPRAFGSAQGGDRLHPGALHHAEPGGAAASISLPSRLVESMIAASVVLAALNNLRGTIERRRWVLAFVFGLIHGFGFASVLADLGLPQGALVLALVGFNVGVELGQTGHRRRPSCRWPSAARHPLLPRGVLTVGSILVARRRLVVRPAGLRHRRRSRRGACVNGFARPPDA